MIKYEKKTCFVIMPFSQTTKKHTEEYWNKAFKAIENIAKSLNFVCKRSQTGPHLLIKNIVKQIHKSDIVIAILTDFNPNVWYELGIRHSLKNGTLMLLEKGQKIPSDIISYGFIFYEDGFLLSRGGFVWLRDGSGASTHVITQNRRCTKSRRAEYIAGVAAPRCAASPKGLRRII